MDPGICNHGHNGFVIAKADYEHMNIQQQDEL
jgi:hypothetical protein